MADNKKKIMTQKEYPSDEELLPLAKSGNVEGTEKLLEKYKYLVRMNAKSLFFLGGEKEDLLQEGMIALYQAIASFDASLGIPFYSYADSCISNKLKTVLRDSNRLKHSPLNTYISFYSYEDGADSNGKGGEGGQRSIQDVLEAGSSSDPMQIAIAAELSRYLLIRMEKELSDLEQEALELYVRGETSGSAAIILGKSPKTTDNAINRAKKKVSRMIEEWNAGAKG